jgi:hypothetical protein
MRQRAHFSQGAPRSRQHVRPMAYDMTPMMLGVKCQKVFHLNAESSLGEPSHWRALVSGMSSWILE